jgi:hypothetical protein
VDFTIIPIKREGRNRMKKIIIAFLMFSLIPTNTYAKEILPGNLLISTGYQIYEYTTEGSYVQNFLIQYPGGYSITEHARDIAADVDGHVYVYNGTVHPYMSTYESTSGTWSHITYDGLSTVNNAAFGGIDVFDNTVFVSDMFTYGGGEAHGVVAFDTMTGQALRFANEDNPIDVTMGLDGFLYTLAPGGNPCGTTINKYDPISLEYIDSIHLTDIFGWTEHRSIAVDYNGDIFIADWDGDVHHISKDGVLIDTIRPTCDWIGYNTPCVFLDIDISQNGEIALGTLFGEIFLTDNNFSSISKFDVDGGGAFVEFVPVAGPEPTTIPITSVDLDIKPGSYPNNINLKSKGVIPVAILTTDDFDATVVDPLSVSFGPDEALEAHGQGHLEDVDGDGDLDLMLHFKTSETGITCGDTEAGLTAETFEGQLIEGIDSLNTVRCH